MRISTATSFYAPVESMLRQQAEIERTQREISSGKRLQALAESPAQAAQASDLDRYLSANERYATNADIAAARLKMGESTITSGIDLLQRIRELTVQGANDSLDVTARKAIAVEVRELNGQLMALGNRRNESGEYIFAGTQINSTPFVRTVGGVQYQGDWREREIPISDVRSIADGFTGGEIFVDIVDVTAGSPNTESVFDTLDRLATALETSPLTPAARAQVSTELGSVLRQVDEAINNFSDARSSIGARLQIIDESETFRVDQEIAVKETLSNLRDVDFAEALARLNAQMTALQVAQQAYSRISSRTLFDYL